MAAFGANEWLVEEMYERYKQDPNSVDKAWWDFFRNYHEKVESAATSGNGARGTTATAPRRERADEGTTKPAAKAEPKQEAKPAAQESRTSTPAPKPAKTTPAKDVQPKPDAKAAAPASAPVPK
ncbi:MAG: 2-oxoglutarate dehydrogenase E1 subunit family protein, partial [Nocardioides sp.]